MYSIKQAASVSLLRKIAMAKMQQKKANAPYMLKGNDKSLLVALLCGMLPSKRMFSLGALGTGLYGLGANIDDVIKARTDSSFDPKEYLKHWYNKISLWQPNKEGKLEYSIYNNPIFKLFGKSNEDTAIA